MNKEQFLNTLNASLKPLSQEERSDILRDFEEYFNGGFEEGKTEGEICEGLGSPYKIAEELLATYHIEKEVAQPKAEVTGSSVLAAILLIFFNLIIVFGPLMGLAGVMLAGWAVGVSFIASPVLVLLGSAIFMGSFEFFDLFASLALTGFGFFIVMGMFYLTRIFIRLLTRYVRFNVDFVKGGANL